MEKEFVPYDLAVKLKALGFDNIPCFGVYYGEDMDFMVEIRETQYSAQKGFKNGILAPTFSQAFKWLRDKYKIYGVLKPIIGSKNGYDSYPILGWDFDIFITNLDKDNSYYMGYPIGEWFTATLDRLDEGDVLSDYVDPMTHEVAEFACLENIIGILELRIEKEKVNNI